MVDVQNSLRKKMVLGKGNSPGPYEVVVSTPIPRRETPLEGTKTMLTAEVVDGVKQMNVPQDSAFDLKVHGLRENRNIELSPKGLFFGDLAYWMSMAVVFWMVVDLFTQLVLLPDLILLGVFLVFHGFVISSMLMTHGKCPRAGYSLAIFYAGIFVTIIIRGITV